MTRHSFIQMSKLSNVKGRISYVTSPARQENLYATYNTTDAAFWTSLARENQQEFKRSGTEGKCIEAREFIIALPEKFTRYDPQRVLTKFTEEFQKRYNVECVSGLHHNKAKTNYHIHLIFSERRLLPEPVVKVATRNMFYDEAGKHVRTKKEITGEDGQIRPGCTVIKKGEVYESHMFSIKDARFKQEGFVAEVKEFYTSLINRYISDPEQQLKVFDPQSVYLPTKKIGKNNPKAEEIRADNAARQEWNRTADMALLTGIPEAEILEVKQTEIHEKVRQSIHQAGWLPHLFRAIVGKARDILRGLIRQRAILPKPTLDIDMAEFRAMRNLMIKVRGEANSIRYLQENVLPDLKQQLATATGIFRGKERKDIAGQIQRTEQEISHRPDVLPTIVQAEGYPDVQTFSTTYRKAEAIVSQYNREMAEWERKVQERRQPVKMEPPPETRSVRERLRRLQNEGRRQQTQPRRGAVDRDSR